jgi:integrase
MGGRRQQGEGSLYHRTDRKQWVAVADLGWKNGKRDRREFTGPTPQKALDGRDEFLAARRDGFTLPRGRQPTVGEWVLHWGHHTAKARVERTTWEKSYRLHVEDYIAGYFDRIPLPDLQAEDIEDWHDHMLERPSRSGGTLSPRTVGVAHSIFSSALQEAVKRHRIPFNPCMLVPPPAFDVPPPEPPLQEELDMLLARCETWPNGARWAVGICTGMRQGEVLGLRWRDVRLKDPATVTVNQVLARLAREWVFKAPKSRKGYRTIPLPKIAVTALRTYRDGQEVTDIKGLMFTINGRPVHGREDRRDWAALLADLGLPHYRVHDLRHAYATMLLEEGHDPRVVQDLMGWSSAAMAEVYQHVRPVMHARVVASLDARLGS